MRLLRLTAAAAAAAVLASTAVMPASASDDDECSGPAAPARPDHSANAAPVAVADRAVVVWRGLAVVDVLDNDEDPDGDQLGIVGVSGARYGSACVDDGRIVYRSDDRLSPDGTDTITYAVSDGDRYRTATLTVDIAQVAVQDPVVVRRLEVTKGRVTRSAKLRFTNVDSTFTVRVHLDDVDSFESTGGVETIVLAPGASATWTTRLRRPMFIATVSEPTVRAVVQVGDVRTRSGRVATWEDWWFDGDDIGGRRRS